MDTAVSIVRAYLAVNGYLAIAEEPVFLEDSPGSVRVATDIDLMAARLASPRRSGDRPTHAVSPLAMAWDDPAWDHGDGSLDIVIAEVKEQATSLNDSMRSVGILEHILRRLGAFDPDEVASIAQALRAEGSARASCGARVRVVLFGRIDAGRDPAVTVVSVGHVVGFLQQHIRDSWDVLRRAQFKDPALSYLMTLEKARRMGDFTT